MLIPEPLADPAAPPLFSVIFLSATSKLIVLTVVSVPATTTLSPVAPILIVVTPAPVPILTVCTPAPVPMLTVLVLELVPIFKLLAAVCDSMPFAESRRTSPVVTFTFPATSSLFVRVAPAERPIPTLPLVSINVTVVSGSTSSATTSALPPPR